MTGVEFDEDTGVECENAESTDKDVMVEFERSTFRCWETTSSPSPVYISANIPLSAINYKKIK